MCNIGKFEVKCGQLIPILFVKYYHIVDSSAKQIAKEYKGNFSSPFWKWYGIVGVSIVMQFLYLCEHN